MYPFWQTSVIPVAAASIQASSASEEVKVQGLLNAEEA